MEETVVKLALSYYDDLIDKFNPLFKKVADHRRFIKDSDLERNTIEYYDRDGKVVFRSEYEILGVYNKSQKIWAWGWSDPKNKKNEIYISRKILDYGFDIDHSLILKTELIASRFIISDKIQVDMHVALASYLSKKVVFRYIIQDTISKNTFIYYVFLLDIDPEEDVKTYLKKDYSINYSS
jgi:hypothetical protein